MKTPLAKNSRWKTLARPFRFRPWFERLEFRDQPAAIPAATFSGVPTDAMLGDRVSFNVLFDNTSPTDPGFGPFLDLFLDTTGPDGGASPDGFDTTNLTATYLGQPLPNVTLVPITGATFTHPLTGLSTSVPGFGSRFQAGDRVAVLTLPFGSFTATQPAAPITVTMDTSPLADVGTALPMTAIAGFRYGNDALDNPGVDPPIRGSQVDSSISPVVMKLSKTYLGPEDETATGPNFKRRYRLDVDIATGQPMTNVRITDNLANSMQITGTTSAEMRALIYNTANSTPGSGANSFNVANLSGSASTIVPGGTLTYNFGAKTGVAGVDASFEFEFFVTLNNLNNPATPVVPQGTDSTFANNTGRSDATWTPLDNRDTANQAVSIVLPPNAHTLQQHSLATQKTVTAVDRTTLAPTGGTILPGSTLLRYDIAFQVSDYFAVQDVILDDILSDGQRVFVRSVGNSTIPTLQVSNAYHAGTNTRSNSAIAAFSGANSIDYQERFTTRGTVLSDPTSGPFGAIFNIQPAAPAAQGESYLRFKISQELIARGFLGGFLIGGEIANGGSAPSSSLPPLFGATQGIITFYTEVKEEFSDYFPSTDRSVDQLDVLSNSVPQIFGNQLDTTSLTTIIGTGTDNTAASVELPVGNRSKSLYAVNGQTTNLGTKPAVQPGDLVTYRLTYTLPLSSFENLHLVDYAPLPVFPIPGTISFSSAGGIPAVNTVTVGPSDTYFSTFGFGPRIPVIVTDSIANSVDLSFGSFEDIPLHRATTIDLLITLRVSDAPFATDLFLTNQLRVSEGSTNAGSATFDQIVQFDVITPTLSISKGVVGYNTTGMTLGGIGFNAPGGATTFTVGGAPASTGNALYTAAQSSAVAGSNLGDAVGENVDAGDTVRYAIVIQNQGRGDAYDVVLTDQIPADYNFPINLGAMNFTVRRGDGTLLLENTDYTATYNNTTGAFQITLIDNYSAGNTTAATRDDRLGGISRGKSGEATALVDVVNGSNSIIVTYDVTLKGTVISNQNIVNTATITNYAKTEGGIDVTVVDLSDPALVNIKDPIAAKTLNGTEFNYPGNNAADQAVIGEFVTYTVTFTIPEGVTDGTLILDTLDDGLAFVDVTGVSASGGLSFVSGGLPTVSVTPANTVISLSGKLISWGLGTITNSDTDNSSAETITITYRVVVLNTNVAPANNQANALRNNSVSFTWTGNSLPAVSANNITIVEPTLTNVKNVRNVTQSGTFATSAAGDAGDVIEYRITLGNGNAAADTTAFDVTLSDLLPTSLSGLSIVSVTSSGGGVITVSGPTAVLADAFEIVAGELRTKAAYNLDMAKNTQIVIIVSGTFSGATGRVTPNIAEVRWTSLDGSVVDRSGYNTASDERDGSGGVLGGGALNDYRRTSTANLESYPLVRKTIVATSESHTSGSNLVVGEIVRYRLVTSLGEGTANNFQVRDDLPPGLMFLNDGSARFGFLSTNGTNISSTGITNISALSGGGITGDQATLSTLLSSSLTGTFGSGTGNLATSFTGAGTAVGTTYTSGQDVYFRFGDLSNIDSDTDVEYVIIEFNALVTNEIGNQNGVSLNNVYTVLVDTDNDGNPGYVNIVNDVNGDGVSNVGDTTVTATDTNNHAGSGTDTPAFSSPATITIREPVLTIVKRAIATTGSVITYSVDVTNTGTATAFDVTVQDILPAQLNLNLASIGIISSGGATTGTPDHDDPTNRVRFHSVDIPIGGSITISYQATVISAGVRIDNTAATTYTSLPNLGSAGNPTNSNTPGGSGGADGERNGIGGVNDYASSDPESLGSLGDTVWVDLNADGVQQVSEPGIPNALVTVRWFGPNGIADDLDDSVITATTDSNGFYLVSGLPLSTGAVNYRVSVGSLPPGLTQATYDLDNGTTAADGSANLALTTTSPVGTPGNRRDVDFGYRGLGQVGDTVFLDINNNGAAESGEGISNVTVTLTGDLDGDGVDETLTTTTNAAGNYSFAGLRTAPAGVNYLIAVNPATLPPGVSQTFDPDGTPNHQSNAILTTASPIDLTRDFGYRGPGSIGDTIFLDVNNNGLPDSGEGIANVTVTLTGDFDLDGVSESVTAVTNTNGLYLFSGLVTDNGAGGGITYTVTVNSATLPTGLSQTVDPDGVLNHQATATLTNGSPTNLTRDFGYRGSGAIGDTVFLDVNNNNVADAGEGITGVQVTLTGDLDGDGANETVTTLTDSLGIYQISGLRTTGGGVTYSVLVNSATLPGGVAPSFDPDATLDHQASATLTNASPSNQTRDFGYRGVGSVGDTIFLDVNNNGVPNAGEGIANVTLTLTGDFDNDGTNEVVTTTTDTNGFYQFTGLVTSLAGVNYTVAVSPGTLPGGLTQTVDPDGTLNHQSVSTLTNAAPSDPTRDFGYRGPGSIGDTIFLDINNNGTPEPGEGIANVGVTLTGDLDGDGQNESVTTTTDANGVYGFSGLRTNLAGVTYTVTVNTATLPAGVTQTVDPDGLLNNLSTATLTDASAVNLTRDFGYRGPGSIGDTIFLDVNNNGIPDSGEGISNVTLTLTGDFDLDGLSETVSTVTDTNGLYLFSGLVTDNGVGGGITYTVQVNAGTLPPGVSQTVDPDGIPNNQSSRTLTIVSPTDLTRDFGYRGPGSIGDTIFLDVNNNGLPDSGEGIANVTVTLTGDLDGDGSQETVTAITDSSGTYLFSGLRTTVAGVPYTVGVDSATLPAGFLQTVDPDGTLDHQSVATLTDLAVADLTRDFGYRGPGSVGDTVFLDVNGNDQADSGEGIAGVQVTLTADLDGDGSNESVTATTDTDGYYLFSGLRTTGAGVVYQVTIDSGSLPIGVSQTFDPDSVLDAQSTSTLTDLTPTDLTRDFGYRGSGSIGDTVFLDINENGLPDPGEGIANATVSLTGDFDGDGFADTLITTTDTNGIYGFTGLVTNDGSGGGIDYLVVVDARTLPANVGQTVDPDGVLDDRSTATLSDDFDTDLTRDFGYRVFGQIGDTVFVDINNNGIPDPGEGLTGITVTLTGDLDGDGSIESVTAVTDANGFYLFSGLRTDGVGVGYLVTVDSATLPAGLVAWVDPDGTLDHQSTTVLTDSAAVDLTRDFGYRGPGALGDFVWVDVDRDGVQDPVAEEPGLASVQMNLTWAGQDGVFGTNDDVTSSVLTSGDGRYQFTGLPTGLFRVDLVAGTLPAGLSPTFDFDSGLVSPDHSAVVALTLAAPTEDRIDFGYAGSASLGDRVWVDLDGDGVQDGNEPGLTGVTVQATWAGPDGDFNTTVDNAVRTLVTDANGNYLFTNLPGGNYRVAVISGLPAQVTNTGDPDGTFDGQHQLTLQPTSNIDTVDFGYRGAASVRGSIYHDANFNGRYDLGSELGIAGAVVTLTGTDERGKTITLQATTNAVGAYAFTGLLGGTYRIRETQPKKPYIDGRDTLGTVAGKQRGLALANDFFEVTLTPGDAGIQYLFGENLPTSIHGYVWMDHNNDGIRGFREQGIPGVSVLISGTVFAGTPMARKLAASDLPKGKFTVTTDATGRYMFPNLPPGVYSVTEFQPIAFQDGREQNADRGAKGVLVQNDRFLNVRAESSRPRGALNFGELGATGRLSGRVFVDTNNNGVRDPGEMGIPGVTVRLTGQDLTGQQIDVSVVTDVNGNYLFRKMRPGTYAVTQLQPIEYVDGKDRAGSRGGQTANDVIRRITLGPNQAAVNYLFAERGLTPEAITKRNYLATSGPSSALAPAGSGVAVVNQVGDPSGYVYVDANNNGKRDPWERGIAGVMIELLGTTKAGAKVYQAALTDAKGFYQFDNLAAGTYSVRETQPLGYRDGRETLGSHGGQVLNDVFSSIVLKDGDVGTGYNFGELPALAKKARNTVFADLGRG